MKKIKQLTILLAFILLLAGCDMSGNEKEKGPGDPQKRERPPAEVSVFVAKKADVPLSFQYPARVVSEQSVDIVAKVSGTLVKEYFKPGSKVKAGDTLFLIEPDKYQAARDIAKANLSLAQANFERADLNYKRAKRLQKSNSISQKELDNAIADYRITQAQIENAKAALKNAEIDLGYTLVKAPFDGVLGDRYQDVGTYISLQNAKLLRLTKLNPLYAKFAIADVDVLNLNKKTKNKEWKQKGAKTILHIENKSYNGTTEFIDRVINEETGSLDAKAIFDNNEGELLPGLFGTVEINDIYQKDGYKIPQIAIQQDLASSFVYTIVDGRVKKSPVKVVYQKSDYAVVSQGLNDGDKIIIDNFMKIGQGAPVVEVKEK